MQYQEKLRPPTALPTYDPPGNEVRHPKWLGKITVNAERRKYTNKLVHFNPDRLCVDRSY